MSISSVIFLLNMLSEQNDIEQLHVTYAAEGSLIVACWTVPHHALPLTFAVHVHLAPPCS
jgi:hypothetical protein